MIPDSDGGFRCFACEAVFTTRQALSRHKLKVHGSKSEERYQCPYCSHVGSRAYDVFSCHIRKDHRERAGSTCLNDIKCVRGRAVPTPLMQKKYTPSSRAGTTKGVSSPITHPEEKEQSVAPASVTEATEMSGDMSPYTPKFTSGVDGTYPTYYPGGKTIEELQKTPSPLNKRKRITPYWEPEEKRFLSTEQELAKPFPLATPEVPRLSEELGPMPTISVNLPSAHVVPTRPGGIAAPIMVEVEPTRTPQTSLQTRNKATRSKPTNLSRPKPRRIMSDNHTQTDLEEPEEITLERPNITHIHTIEETRYPDGRVEKKELYKWYRFLDNYSCCDKVVGRISGGLD